jgi:hypothetical protein
VSIAIDRSSKDKLETIQPTIRRRYKLIAKDEECDLCLFLMLGRFSDKIGNTFALVP